MIIGKIVRSRIRSKQVVICRKKNTIIKNTNSMLANEKCISFILIGISLSFLILTMPFVIEYLDKNKTNKDNPNWNLIVALTNMLMYLNHVSLQLV